MSRTINQSRRIYLAHGDHGIREILTAILNALKHEVVLTTDSGNELISKMQSSTPDLIIATPRLSDMDGIEALIQIASIRPTAAVIVARSDDLDKVERAMEDHVMAYLVEPVTAETLQPAIYLAERRFEHFQSLVKQIDKLETKLEERKLIERAKGIVMKLRGVSEDDAHRFLQASATKQREKLIEIARSICDAGDILQP